MGAWDISTAVWLQLFDVSGEEGFPAGVFFKPDGLKMYIIGYAGDEVNEYDLSVAWDISTAVWLQLFDVSDREANPGGIFFKPDGTKMYIIGYAGDEVNEYDLSVAWDISTAVWLQLKSVAGEETIPMDVFFKPDGTKMYITGLIGQDVNEYNLSVAWDVTTAVWLQLFDVSGEESAPRGLFFKPDGLKMYIIGSEHDEVNEYDLSVAWDISTAVWLQLFDVSDREETPEGIFFKPDGTKMYITGSAGIEVNEYDLVEVGTNMQVNISDVFKDISEIKVNIGDVWKAVTKIQINIGDVWKDVFG